MVYLKQIAIAIAISTSFGSSFCHAWSSLFLNQVQRRTTANKPGSKSFHRPLDLLATLDVEAGSSSSLSFESEPSSVLSSEPRTSALFPELDEDGLYNVENPEQHKAFMEANRDKLVVLKVFAPWCRACKGLEPKFLAVAREKKYENLPLVWAKLSIQHNKAFVKTIGVLALPTVQFYVGGALADTFPCGPSKVPILKRKLAQLVNENVDPITYQVKTEAIERAGRVSYNDTMLSSSAPLSTQQQSVSSDFLTSDMDDDSSAIYPPTQQSLPKNDTAESKPTWMSRPSSRAAEPLISQEERNKFRETIKFFSKMSIADFDQIMDKAVLLTFEPGAIIMREGKPGRTFYIIQSGEVEICQKTFAEDPLQYSSSYLGTVVNRLEEGDFFGERSLLTGEPRAASIKAVEKTSCYAFDRDDFPLSSPLSGRRNQLFTNNDLDVVNDKYGVNLGTDFYQQQVQQQIRDANAASQVRGSVNRPEKILGVDTEDEIVDDSAADDPNWMRREIEAKKANDAIFNVLRRFKMIRHVSKCFDYIELTNAKWGDSGIRTRRAMLVSRLSEAQRQEYSETFDLIDTDDSGFISLLELKNVMDSVGEERTEQELMDLIMAKDVGDSEGDKQSALLRKKITDRPQLSKQDFMGLMAEAEFYYLFRDIFKTLDPLESGFVRARDLDRVLCGIRDLITDDRKSIIDAAGDDRDMLIDYEQFTRMLLGS